MPSISAGETPCFWHLDRLPHPSQIRLPASGSEPSHFCEVCVFVQPFVNISGCTDFAKMNAFSAHWRPVSRDNLPRRDARQAGPAGLLGESREFTATRFMTLLAWPPRLPLAER